MPLCSNLIYVAAPARLRPAAGLPVRSASGKYREGWAEKFRGKAPLRIGDRPCLWFHAVSVGEVLLLRPLLRELARRRPGWDLVVSTTTTTGLAVARRTYPDLVTFYAPLDFSWSTRRAVARIRPTVLALVELELWPNLVRAAKRAGARVAIVNGRLEPAEPSRATGGCGGRSGRPCAGSTPWPRRTRNTPSGSSTWASPATGSA